MLFLGPRRGNFTQNLNTQNWIRVLGGFSRICNDLAKAVISFNLKFLVLIYKLLLSPILGGSCRFEPSCSDYAMEALSLHPPLKALSLIIKRLSQCRPGGAYGIDPVPPCHCYHKKEFSL